MRRIRKQFGVKFAEALAQCPTLVADLKEIRQNGVKIRRVGGHCQAYSNRDRKTIYIGSRCNLSYQLVALAHETIHVLVSPTPDPMPRITSRQGFIDMCLNAETDCIVHEVRVVAELLAAGYDVDAHSLSWYRRYKTGGRAAILKAMQKAITSNTGERYPEYYGAWYDEVVRPADRVPFHRLHGSGAGSDTRIFLPLIVVAKPRKAARGRDRCPRFCIDCNNPVRLTLPAVVSGKRKR
jgi:hypothetical protein